MRKQLITENLASKKFADKFKIKNPKLIGFDDLASDDNEAWSKMLIIGDTDGQIYFDDDILIMRVDKDRLVIIPFDAIATLVGKNSPNRTYQSIQKEFYDNVGIVEDNKELLSLIDEFFNACVENDDIRSLKDLDKEIEDALINGPIVYSYTFNNPMDISGWKKVSPKNSEAIGFKETKNSSGEVFFISDDYEDEHDVMDDFIEYFLKKKKDGETYEFEDEIMDFLQIENIEYKEDVQDYYIQDSNAGYLSSELDNADGNGEEQFKNFILGMSVGQDYGFITSYLDLDKSEEYGDLTDYINYNIEGRELDGEDVEEISALKLVITKAGERLFDGLVTFLKDGIVNANLKREFARLQDLNMYEYEDHHYDSLSPSDIIDQYFDVEDALRDYSIGDLDDYYKTDSTYIVGSTYRVTYDFIDTKYGG